MEPLSPVETVYDVYYAGYGFIYDNIVWRLQDGAVIGRAWSFIR